MTTTETATITTAEDHRAEPATVVAPRRRLGSVLARTALVVLVGLSAFAGLGAVKSEPASAATTAGVHFCMKQSNGLVYGNSPVILYRWDSYYQRWTAAKNGTTAANGCATWQNVAPNAYYYTGVSWTYSVGPAVYAWSGNTPTFVWVGGAGLYENGTGTATRYRIA